MSLLRISGVVFMMDCHKILIYNYSTSIDVKVISCGSSLIETSVLRKSVELKRLLALAKDGGK